MSNKKKEIYDNHLQMVIPPLTAWQWQASVLSILWGRKCTHNWIYSNYILPTCTVDDWSNGQKLYVDYIPHPFFDRCPWLKCRTIDRTWINDNWGGVHNFIKECVDDGYYIFTLADQGEIRGVADKYLHELFVFGYDLLNNEAYVADFFNKKFGTAKVDLDIVCRAIDSVSEDEDYWDDFRGGIYLFKFIENVGYVFHKEVVKKSLYLYLNPKYILSPKDLKSTRYIENRIYYGIDVYDCFITHIKNSESKNYKWDQRAFHNLYDHKVLMSKRIVFMMENNYIPRSEELIDTSQWIEKQAMLLCNLCIKMNIMHSWNKESCNNMISTLMEMRHREKELYTKILGLFNDS